MKTAINTRTPEEYDALMRYYKSQGIDYSEPEREGEKIWEIDKGQTCISVWIDGSLVYGNVEFYKMRHVTIIPYTEFAKANITPEPDFKALYLEGRELLEEANKQLDLWSGHQKLEVMKEIKAFLTKHKDLTPSGE